MIIEKGKYYKASDGSKVGPMAGVNTKWVEAFGRILDPEWGNDGTPHHRTTDLHLIAEWQDEDTGTLKEINVKARDVVECVRYDGSYWTVGCRYTITNGVEVPSNEGVLYPIDAPYEALFKLISRADTTPTLWRDMTDAEKGALLLAASRGQAIEMFWPERWRNVQPMWADNKAYRIKPNPITTKGTVSVKNEYGVVTHTSDIDITDGIPDTSTIELEDV